MPYPIEEKNEINVVTPWGKARATEYSTTDQNKNIFYIFTFYNFSKNQKYNIDLLKRAPDCFLLNKKCIADIVKQTPLQDSNRKVWPQITFKGYCVTPNSDYRVLVLIADNRVYQFHVGYLPRPRKPELMKKDDLESALKELLSKFSN